MFTFVSLASWFIKNYTVFAIVICVTTITSILLSLYQLIQVYKRIYAMAYYSVTVAVLRDNKVATLSSEELTPGDIVFLKEAIKLPFEAVILEGDVLMN